MEELFAMEKPIMEQIILTLKSIKVDGYESMEKLVNCVMYLEMAMNPPKEETEEKAKEVVEPNG